MEMFDYTQRKNQLNTDFARENMIQQQGAQLGQQRYARQRGGMTQGFQRAFPKMTGQMAGRLGSGVRSGVANQGLGRFVGDFQRQLGNMDIDQATAEANFAQQQAARMDAYQRMLQALDEELAQSRLGQDPYAGVS